ncbi:MAG: TrmH family RNA methyltransferase [Chloroflexota bacterium]
MAISKVQNPTVRYVRSLSRSSVRYSERAYLIEGVRLVLEAMRTDQPVRLILYAPDVLSRSDTGSVLLPQLSSWSDRLYEVEEHVFRAAAQTQTPSGVLAVLALPQHPPLSSHAAARFGVLLDAVSDPGNAGTILRSALAFGADYAVACPDTADPFAPKVVRAGMGAHFCLPVYSRLSWDEIARSLEGVTLVAASPSGDQAVQTFAWPDRTVLVIGSEAAGLSESARSRVSATVRIPIAAGVESLNAAVAASILLFAGPGQLIHGD